MSKRKEIQREVTIVGAQQATEQSQPEAAKPMKIPISFDTWWLQTQQKYKLKPELKSAVQRHFQVRGFINDSDKFMDGLRDFGFNT